MSKSLEICVSGQHKTRWQFFNDGKLFDDETFHIVEKCQFNDDFPAYLTIFLVGHLVVPIAMYVEIVYQPSYWLHAALWAPMVILLSIGLLQPIKGMIVALQWHMGMHGFAAAKQERAEYC